MTLEVQATEVVTTLQQKGLYITTVESCTGGGLANWITNISGSSEVMQGANVTYSNQAKIALGVPEAVIDEFTVYSLQTAQAMAVAGLQVPFKADISVGITGSISRVDPANPNSTPGEVYIAVAAKGHEQLKQAKKFIFADQGERWEVKDRAIGEALTMVLALLAQL